MKKRTPLKLLCTIVFTVVPILSFSQGVPGPPSFPSSPKQAPVDGGLGVLALAGGAYAFKKLRSLERE